MEHIDSLRDPDWYFEHVLAYASPGGSARVTGSAGRWQQWWRHRALDIADEPCGALAASQGFVLTTAQARGQGRLRADLRRDCRRGCWTRVARGVLSPMPLAQSTSRQLDRRRRHTLAACAATLVRPGQVISSRSAAVLHGLPTGAVPAVPELTTRQPDTLGRRRGAHVYGATLSSADVSVWFGAPLTTLARTVVDLARHDRRDGLMAADAALHEGLVAITDLRAELDAAYGWPGVRRVREVLALASPLAESPLESVVRLALHDDGFPPPWLQVEIAGYRVDFLWSEQRLVLEADGREKYTDEELWREKRRELRLRREGYRVVRVRWYDVVHNWPETRAYLAQELRFPAGVPA